MKCKFVALAIVLALLVGSLPITALAADGIRVLVDGRELKFDVAPVLENNRTLVPMRAIFEALGAEMYWDNDSQTASALKADTGIAVQIGNPTANVNNKAVGLDVPPKIIGGRIMVPLRFVSEALGCKVGWDGKTLTVTITSADVADTPEKTPDGEGIVGLWSSNNATGGSTVDPFDNINGVYYGGAWYLFKEDGTFKYIIITSGNIVSGSCLLEGKYSCDSETIWLYDIKETWMPYPDDPSGRAAYKNSPAEEKTMKFGFRNNGDTVDLTDKIGKDSYYRVKR